jgi:hypothetical protein
MRLLALPLAAALSLAPFALAQTDGKGIDLKAMREDVEVMRRLLSKALTKQTDTNGAYWLNTRPVGGGHGSGGGGGTGGGTTAAGGLGGDSKDVYQLYDSLALLDGTLRSQAQGFYVPQTGAVFSLVLSAPVKEVAEKESRREKTAKADDEWDRTRQEVRGGGSGGTAALGKVELRGRKWALDSEAIESAIDAVLGVIAEHGRKIRELESSDAIVVALRFEPMQGAWQSEGGSSPENLFSYVEQRSAPAQCVVVRVPVAVLDENKDRKIDREALRDPRVQIVRY